MKVGCYVRVSTEHQAEEGYSISEQTERLKNFCKAKEWTVYKVYTDAGISGAKLDRPALNKMLSDAKNGKIDMVLVYKLDRLSRSQKDILYIIEDILKPNNCGFTSMTENFDTTTPFGMAMMGILAVFAQLEREKIKERMVMGLDARVKGGKYKGGGELPIGYDYDYVNSKLIVNPYEASQVKLIFDMFLKGHSIYSISIYMNEHYTNKYSSYKHRANINRMLRCPIYIGKQTYKGEVYDADHEPIIDDETFYKVQKLMDERKKDPYLKNFKGKALLSGLLRCKCCGAKYHLHSRKNRKGDGRYSYYECYSRAGTSPKMRRDINCKSKFWRMETLDEIIINEIKKLKFDEDYLDKIIAAPVSKPVNNNKVINDEIGKVNEQMGRLMELYSLGNMPIDMIANKMDELNDKKEKLIESLVDENEIPSKMDKKEVLNILDAMDSIFESDDMLEKKNFIRSLIDYIELDNTDNVYIHWNF